jgi:tripartite-type tricarboxylate transporter receptor subunit TctC
MTGVDASRLLSLKTSGDFRAIVTAAFAGTQATVAHLIVALRVGGAMDTAARLSHVYPAW